MSQQYISNYCVVSANLDLDLQLMMVIHESLRLYPPVQVVSREALTNMKFGGIHVPKGGEGMEPAGDAAHRP